jgi:hypothetical protein
VYVGDVVLLPPSSWLKIKLGTKILLQCMGPMGVKGEAKECEALKVFIYISTHTFTLKMEITYYSESSVLNDITLFHIPED